jgi:hypothetical protein
MLAIGRAAAIGWLALSTPTMAQNAPPITAPPVTKAVKHCVSVVHAIRAAPAEDYMNAFFKRFDAFYNPASGKIENNAISVGDQQALFAFNKCMTEQGFPLTY